MLFLTEEYDVAVLEDSPVGTVLVDSLLAQDADQGLNAKITYDIITHNVSNYNYSVYNQYAQDKSSLKYFIVNNHTL